MMQIRAVNMQVGLPVALLMHAFQRQDKFGPTGFIMASDSILRFKRGLFNLFITAHCGHYMHGIRAELQTCSDFAKFWCALKYIDAVTLTCKQTCSRKPANTRSGDEDM